MASGERSIRQPNTRQPTTPQPSTRQRSTRQRRALVAILTDSNGFASAQHIHATLSDRGEDIGLSTVYRLLQTLTDSGQVDVLRTDDGEVLYRLCSSGHHHHVVCRSCGLTVEVEGPSVERWAAQVATEHGFTELKHTVEVFGTCADCAAD